MCRSVNILICIFIFLNFQSSLIQCSIETRFSECLYKDTENQLECIYEDENILFEWNCTCFNNATFINVIPSETASTGMLDEFKRIGYKAANIDVGKVYCKDGLFSLPISGKYLGEVSFDIITSTFEKQNLTVKVCRKETLLQDLLVMIVTPIVLINKCAFGAEIEISSLKNFIIKPKELGICFLVQFCLLPLVSISWSHIFQLKNVMALSLLVASVCPGGGGGYIFSYLINGDVTLAIAASLFSTLLAMLAMPAVIGIYSSVKAIPHEIYIPYTKIILILSMIAIPISSGMFLRYKRPTWARMLVKVIKPLSLFLIAAGLIMMAFIGKYIYLYGPIEGYAFAFILPMSGFLMAIILSKLCGFDWTKTKAITLESGMKNTLLGVAVIELSFTQPSADLASVVIIMVSVGQAVLCLLWYLIHLLKTTFFEDIKDSSIIMDEDTSEDAVAFLSSYH